MNRLLIVGRHHLERVLQICVDTTPRPIPTPVAIAARASLQSLQSQNAQPQNAARIRDVDGVAPDVRVGAVRFREGGIAT